MSLHHTAALHSDAMPGEEELKKGFVNSSNHFGEVWKDRFGGGGGEVMMAVVVVIMELRFCESWRLLLS